MYRVLIRAFAVVAIALSPVWGYSSVQAGRALTPYWPSFDSVGCNAIGFNGGVTIACGSGGYVTTQITSAYGGCSEIDLSVSAFISGPFYVTATAPVAGLQSTVNVNDTGDYYMRLSWVPTTTVGPIEIQMSAPDSGNMSVDGITVVPCPVPPTATPVPPTNTPNPSDTATSTATAGPSHTPTPIPTNTPLPAGHNTYTPTATNTATATGTATPTPAPSELNCGTVDFPLLNCNFIGGGYQTPPDHWSQFFPGAGDIRCAPTGENYGPPVALYPNVHANTGTGGFYSVCGQSVTTSGLSGPVYVQYQASQVQGSANWAWQVDGNSPVSLNMSSCSAGGSTYCVDFLGNINTTTSHSFSILVNSASISELAYVIMNKVYVNATGSTPTPAATSSPTVTVTPTPSITSTPTLTPVPIPGQQETAIPTDTECPGGCAVKALTAIPGQVGTVTTVDTSPFSPLKNLSLSRSSCQPFGYAQIPVPVIHGTPALGSTTPLSFTWTVPVTGAWTNYNSDGTLNISNTAIQPCAMSEIPTFVWDLTYWLSVLMCAIAWFLWLIGFVGRLSGEETING